MKNYCKRNFFTATTKTAKTAGAAIFVMVVALGALILSSCNNLLFSAMVKTPETIVSVSIANESTRSALPTVEFNDYQYSLTATPTVGGAVITYRDKVAYADIKAAISVAQGTYDFVLTAYSGDVAVFSGAITNKTLQATNNDLPFFLLPVQGLTSNASVTLMLPTAGVSRVTAGVSSDPFAEPTACNIAPTSLTIDRSEASKPKVVFSKNDFQTGQSHFVIFYLYDAENNLIAAIPESVISVYGLPSSSTINVGDYTLYDALKISVSGVLAKRYYLKTENFDPAGITVTATVSGRSFALSPAANSSDTSGYATDFSSLVGINKTLTITYKGTTATLENALCRSNYEFTESPVQLSGYNGSFGNARIDGGSLGTFDPVYYKFGDYPQAKKAGDVNLSASIASNGYYIGSDGGLYDKYGSDFYKIEPIVWRVLNAKVGDANNYATTNKALFMAEKCLDGGVKFYNGGHDSTRSIGGHTVYATNYQYSTIRAYLNGLNGDNNGASAGNFLGQGFLNKAFTASAKNKIYVTNVDNSTYSQHYEGDMNDGLHLSSITAEYCGNNTQDKIFLISQREITNTNYGFATKGSSEDKARKRARTELAKAKGVYTDDDPYAHYWLRSQFYGKWGGWKGCYGSNAYHVMKNGASWEYNYTDDADKGIVPLAWVSLSGPATNPNEPYLEVTASPQKQYYAAGESFDETGLTVSYYNGTTKSPLSSGSYTTNFAELTGANQPLIVMYSGLSAEAGFIHKATYQFTETPTVATEADFTDDYKDNRTEIAGATYYKFGDYPQDVMASGVSVSPGRSPQGYFIGTDGNYYEQHGTNYYKVMPIIWRALKTEGDDVLLYAEQVLDSGVPYYITNSKSANDPVVRRYSGNELAQYPNMAKTDTSDQDNVYKTLFAYGYGVQIFPNNYEYSTVRAFLNSIDAGEYQRKEGVVPANYDYRQTGFLTKAFTQTAQGKIIRKAVSNNYNSTCSASADIHGSPRGPSFITRTCPDTQDKVFLLSMNDLTNTAYGFSSANAKDGDNARRRYRTNYSKARGVYDENGYGHYMTRTPCPYDDENGTDDTSKTYYVYVYEDGKTNGYEDVTKTNKGIVPAIWVTTNSSSTPDTDAVTTDILWARDPHIEHSDGNGTYTLHDVTELYGVVGEGYNGGTKGPIIICEATLNNNGTSTPIYLVTLSGTESVDGQATGVWEDLQSGLGGDSAYQTNVVNTVKQVVTDEKKKNSKLVIAGHSLGGMIAQQAGVALEKEGYTVLNVVTYGSPLLVNDDEKTYELHRMCDRSDIVPLASFKLVSDNAKLFQDRYAEDGGFGEEVYDTSFTTLVNELVAAAADNRDVTGPHSNSYGREEIWGGYDALGVPGGHATIVMDLSTKKFYRNDK